MLGAPSTRTAFKGGLAPPRAQQRMTAPGCCAAQECGLVLEDHAVDESSEWRTFSNSDGNGADPNRVGGPSNHLLRDGGLGTSIGKSADGRDAYGVSNLSKLHNRGSNPDRNLVNAFRSIAAMTDRLGLIPIIKDLACEIYKQITESRKPIRGRGASAVHAACVFIACRQEGTSRTFKEICAVAPDASKKEIGRCYKFIVNELEKNLAVNTSTIKQGPSVYISRFCSHLGLPNDATRAARNFMEKVDGEGSSGPCYGKSPITKVAAIIYLICNLKPEHAKDVHDVSRVSGASAPTIKQAYKDFYAVAANYVPAFFAGPELLQNLPVPP
mmetsp:Transcript_28612/g.91240  ORF Transcript_28612/g.91240 Transcript_28612/m.91240 type:complete len:328 (+) Transcript_28612:307-1290(+)